MSKKQSLFEGLRDSLEAAIDQVKGQPRAGTKVEHVVILPAKAQSKSEIKRIRTRLGFTQFEFASIMHVSIKTVEAWEAGKRSPLGPALRMIQILDKDPEALSKSGIYEKRA